ncbi:MAG: hypothetical protein ACYS1A_13900 [Planctomycetota bacterium]
MNITSVMTNHYSNFHLLERRKNKAKTNPIKANQTQFQTRPTLTQVTCRVGIPEAFTA